MVPNLKIILKNVSSSYKILVIFLDSSFAHALKVTIFKVLLLPSRAKAGIQTSRGERKDHNLSLTIERESIRLGPAEKVTFQHWSYFLVLINYKKLF